MQLWQEQLQIVRHTGQVQLPGSSSSRFHANRVQRHLPQYLVPQSRFEQLILGIIASGVFCLPGHTGAWSANRSANVLEAKYAPGIFRLFCPVSTSEMRNFLSNFPANVIKSYTEATKVSPLRNVCGFTLAAFKTPLQSLCCMGNVKPRP